MGIRDEDIARVRETTDLVALAGEHLALKRVGRRFVGLCPFHGEKTPSFSINPELGVYYCFGCQASGDAITFVREVEHLDFVDAVERLAARAGISLTYDDANQGLERRRRERLHEVVGAAIACYHRLLLDASEAGPARQYLRSRGFDGDAVRQFELGYAPDAYDRLSRHLVGEGFRRDEIVAAGLGYENQRGGCNDVFRGRLLFPIHDSRGEPVGFGGRALEGTPPPKYRNTSETAIYHKSRLLYGMHRAKAEIVARGAVVICEGYTDVMALTLAGVPNAVATCGTALADEHFEMVKNLARRVVLAYDADAAGQQAAERCYRWEQRYEVQFEVADLPAGEDPADVYAEDPAALVKAVENAKPFLGFRLGRVVAAADLASVEGRALAAERGAALVAEHPNELVRDQYAMQLADRLDLDVDRVRSTLERIRHAPRRGAPAAAARARPDAPDGPRPVDRRELDALRWAVHAPTLVADRLDEALFADPLARAAFDVLAASVTFAEAVSRADPPVAALLQRLAVEEPDLAGEPAERHVVRAYVYLVEASSRRLRASMVKRGDERAAAVSAQLDALSNAHQAGDWNAAEEHAGRLLGWIAAQVGRGGDRDPSG